MKLNQRIFNYAEEDKLIERQELNDGKSIEIYNLDDYQDIYTEFTNKGKFAVWSCVDNQNYRLYIESGYYKKLAPLYKQNINQVWLDFWDECEKGVLKFKNIIMPIMLVLILAFFFGGAILIKNQTIQLIVALAVAFVFIVVVLFFRRKVNKRIEAANSVSVKKIKDILGEKRFNKLLEDQRSYIDEFFKYDENTEEASIDENVDNNVNTLDDEVKEIEDNSSEETNEVIDVEANETDLTQENNNDAE